MTCSHQPTTIQAPFLEQFTGDWQERWTPSEATKKTAVGGETFSYVGKWSVEEPFKEVSIVGDKGLVAKDKATHHAISAPIAKPVNPKGKTLVVQYEAKFQKVGNCGGGYVKLLEEGALANKEFSDTTPWVIMFGPDLTCPGTKVRCVSVEPADNDAQADIVFKGALHLPSPKPHHQGVGGEAPQDRSISSYRRLYQALHIDRQVG